MAHDYSISDFGLKLIKAYEGFRPAETVLVSGQRVIGYGHEYVPGEATTLTIERASELLKIDLEPFEDMVNHNVFAPLSQNQFDALVSLGFNIGQEAFLGSNVVHNLNIGQPLAAAAGFDEWRKSVIADQTYVVDALVRRRTAEKALFLSPATGVVAAPRNEVPPLHDSTAITATDDVGVFTTSDANGYVEQAPYASGRTQRRRREDGPSGILTLSERVAEPRIYDTGEASHGETPHVEAGVNAISIEELAEEISKEISETTKAKPVLTTTEDEHLSPIALAAAEVSERLDSLMDDKVDNRNNEELVAQIDEANSEPSVNDETKEDIAVIDDTLTSENYIDNTRAANPVHATTYSGDTHEDEVGGIGAYWTALVVGFLLLGGGWWKLTFSSAPQLNELSAFLTPVAMLVGAMMVLGGFYYLLKSELRGRPA